MMIQQKGKNISVTNLLFRLALLAVSVAITLMLAVNPFNFLPIGFQYLYLVPLTFGIYFSCSRLANLFFKNISMAFFTVILMLRYLATPLIMAVSGKYSAMFNGVASSASQKDLAVKLMLYEMLILFVTIELCIVFIYRRGASKKKEGKKAQQYPNTVYIVSICAGLLGVLIFPGLMSKFNFLFVNRSMEVINRKTLEVILSYFLELTQAILFIIAVKYAVKRKENGQKYSRLLILALSVLNIAFLWTTNRMTIFIITGTTLAILLYVFPERKKGLIFIISALSVIMVVLLSSYRLFGTTGSQVDDRGFAHFLQIENLSRQFQIYFAGPDSIAGSAATGEYYGRLLTGKTFLNDTFLAVNFIRQLPIFLHDQINSTGYYFNLYCSNGNQYGLIVPMVGQGYLYFGFLLSPVFTIICTVIMFMAERKARSSFDIGYRYVFQLLTFYFALSCIYNYTIVVQNLFNKFFPLFLIIWCNNHLLQGKEKKTEILSSRYIRHIEADKENARNAEKKSSCYIK